MRGHRLRHVTLDADFLPIEVHGQQEGSQYNGHYGVRCYHPLVAVLGETGDLVDIRLREGNVHTAEGALDFILPLLDRLEREVVAKWPRCASMRDFPKTSCCRLWKRGRWAT